MDLKYTKKLIHEGIDRNKPIDSLVHILDSAIELLLLPDNDFSWSSWEDAEQATEEISKLKISVKSEILPEKVELGVLFAATGPLQEVSLSSGWSDAFIKVADKYDQVEKLLWKNIRWWEFWK